MNLKGKTAIITGAASGMGAADARMIAAEGASVVIADIMEDAGQRCAEEIRVNGYQAEFMHLDISDAQNWARVVDATVSQCGGVDILVNNAGITGIGVDDVLDLDIFDKLVEVNLRGTFLGIRSVVPHMQKRGGSIINISSICSHVGTPGIHIGYHASKGGIRALTKAAAAEYGKFNIRVNSVHPGVMPPMQNQHTGSQAPRNSILHRVPLRRSGEADEVASTVLFLASDASSYVSGVELAVDGGFLAN